MTVDGGQADINTGSYQREQKHPLLFRLFAAIFLVMIFTAVSLVWLYWQDQRNEHAVLAAQENQISLDFINHLLDDNFKALIVSSNDSSKKLPDMEQNIGRFIAPILQLVHSDTLLKLKIYNLSGVAIYSTTKGDVGGASAHPELLAKALHSETSHTVEFYDTFSIEPAVKHDVYVALMYKPLILKGSPVGVIELYKDTTALYQHHQHKVMQIAAIVFVAFLLLYLALIFILFKMDRSVAKWQRGLAESEDKFNKASESAMDAIIIMGPDQRITSWNAAAERIFGYSAAEAIGQELHPLITSHESQLAFKQGFQHFLKTGTGPIIGNVREVVAIRKGGEEFPVEVSIAGLKVESAWHAIGIFHDVTRRKQAEVSIERVNNLYAALSQCSQAIVHSANADELFTRICRAAVESGGMKMAWVGWIDESTLMLKPTAAFGFGTEYLEGIKISSNPDEVFGQGPCGIAMRENRPYWCQDYTNDPLLKPWHERGERVGWKSMATLPLHRNGKVVAAFSLYSGENNAFDEAARGLLQEMVMEIDYALEAYALQAERKQMRESIAESEARFRVLADESPLALQIISPDGRTLRVNPAWEKMWGVSLEALSNYNILHDQQLIDSGIMPFVQKAFAGESAEIPSSYYDLEMTPEVKASQGGFWIRGFIYPILDKQGKVSEVVLIQEDVTASMLSGNALRQSEERFRQLADNINDVFFMATPDWNKILYISPAYEAVWGRTCQSLREQPHLWLESVAAEDQEAVKADYNKKAEGDFSNVDSEYRIVRTDGSVRWIYVRVFPVKNDAGEIYRVAGVAKDITERKQAKESLLLTQFVSDHAPSGIIWVDEQARICYVNKTACNSHGYTKEEMLGMSIPDIDPDFPMEVWPAHWQELKKAGSSNFETRHSHKDGTIFPVEVSANFVRFGSKEYNISYVRDITVRKKEERHTARLFQAVQQSGEAVLMTDINGVIEYVNPAFTTMTGYSAEDTLGKTPAILKSEAQDPSFYKELWQTITRGEVWHGTLIDKKKDGSFYPALMSVVPILDDHGDITHYVSLQQDMTEYKRLEDQFLQAQKMEAIGTLVGGIAHDFNNMLAAIQGNVYLSKIKLEGQSDVLNKLDNIELLGMRAADMVKQLLTFARKDRVELGTFSMNPFINEALNLAKAGIPENIALVYDICPEELVVEGDTTQMQQVLMNLLSNARDALSDVSQPQVSCSLKPYAANDKFLKRHPEIKGERFAQLAIRDNGAGIPKAIVRKVFEPFFTTKGVGDGTGLGLAMVYGAVQSHGGIIEVESEMGAGTSFLIYLPLVEFNGDIEAASDSSKVLGAGETILLVDDEYSMRETTSEVLESLGYKVFKASDGEQALEIFKARQQEIALILTDIVMPKMGGIELAKCIRQLDKRAPIIFATGYDKESEFTDGNQVDKSLLINKPFSYDKLSRMIQDMIKTA